MVRLFWRRVRDNGFDLAVALLLQRSLLAYCAASFTRKPIFGREGSKSGSTP